MLLRAHIVGGLPTLDNSGGQTTKSSLCWKTMPCGERWKHISDLTTAVVDRLSHYFSTYKLRPYEVTQRSWWENLTG